MKRALVLFTRDLRVHDQPSLRAAMRTAEEIVPAFVLDRELLALESVARGQHACTFACATQNRHATWARCDADSQAGKPHVRTCSPTLQPGGETAARAQLSRWLRTRAGRYGTLHDDLAGDGTSRLSAYVHFGCLSPVTVLRRGDGEDHDAADELTRQLCWPDFHQQVLAARPDIPHADYRSRGDRWRRDVRSLRAWREGRTGYPIVDAGMRQLAAEGFMHNRARLIVASFLTKTLYLDWRSGAGHFAHLLIDADVANNVGNWQWVAGTGNDTRPNRVLNPLRQAQRFDPRGEYVRRYVPELQGLEGGNVHRPWLLAPAQRRRLRYPAPLVDHQAAAAELRARRYSSSSPA